MMIAVNAEVKKAPWNARIVCIKSHEPYFTLGKTYKVEDGIFEDNLGDETDRYEKVDDVNAKFVAQFAEVSE